MKSKLQLVLIVLGSVAASSANALTAPVSEPNMLALLGLGAMAAILAVRMFRK